VSTLGERLRQARRAAGLTQADLTDPGVSVSMVSRIESGSRQPSTETLHALARRLGVSPAWLRWGRAGDAPVDIAAVTARAESDLAHGDPRAALECLSVVDLSQVPAERRATTAVLRSHAQERCGDFDGARAGLEPLWRDAVAERRPADVLALTRGLLYLYLVEGRSAVAVDVGTRARALLDDTDLDPEELTRLEATVCWALLERGDRVHAWQRAVGLHAWASRACGNGGQAVALWNLSSVEEALGRYDLARRHIQQAVDRMPESRGEDGRDYFRAREQLAWTLLVDGRRDQAAAALDELLIARDGLDLVGGPDDLVELDLNQSRAHLLLGDLSSAEHWAESALHRGDLPTDVGRAGALLSLADVRIARGGRVAAVELTRSALDLLVNASAGREVTRMLRETGVRLLALGEGDGASVAFRRLLAGVGVTDGVSDASVA
jgi:transcriptional regulator with XRE-family HTH domain